MYDQVTLGLNVDPFILSALKEDITSEDVSTNSVMTTSTGRRGGFNLQTGRNHLWTAGF